MCVRDPAGSTSSHVTLVDCRTTHDYEVMTEGRFRGVTKWTGYAAMEKAAARQCERAYASYVGIDLASSLYDISWVYADKVGWLDGTRTLICVVYDPSGDPLRHSVRDSHE